MSGDIKVAEEKWWMVAGWAFRGVLRSALTHIPTSMTSLKCLVEERIKGWNFLDLESECTAEERIALLAALREGYIDTELAGASSFGDPSYFPSFLEGFAELIHLVEEEFEKKGGGGYREPGH
jgi:hypothetical protein